MPSVLQNPVSQTLPHSFVVRNGKRHCKARHFSETGSEPESCSASSASCLAHFTMDLLGRGRPRSHPAGCIYFRLCDSAVVTELCHLEHGCVQQCPQFLFLNSTGKLWRLELHKVSKLSNKVLLTHVSSLPQPSYQLLLPYSGYGLARPFYYLVN